MRLYDSSELYYYLTEIKGMPLHEASEWVADLNDYYAVLGHLKDNTKIIPEEEV